MNRTIQTASIAAGKTADINGAGKFLKIVRVSPPSLVVVQVGDNYNAVEGMEIPFPAPIASAKITAPGAISTVTVQYYIGDFPWIGPAMVEPNGTLCTGNWISLDPIAGGYFVTLKGTLVLNGTTYRRKLAIMQNFSAAPSTIIVQGSKSAANAMVPTGGVLHLNGGSIILSPLVNNVYTSVPIETDDDLIVSSVAGADLGILQTWLPVMPV
jgi:hypothetical protein